MILVRARHKSQMADITYDPVSDGGVDVLELLVASMFENLTEPLLIDFAGRRICAPEDLDDIKVVELIPERLQGSVEEILEQKDNTEWGQHDHLLNPTNEKDLKGELIRGTTVVNVWVLDKEDTALHRYCTSTIFPPTDQGTSADRTTANPNPGPSGDVSCILQPVHRIMDTTFALCTRCAQMVAPDLMQKGSERLLKFSCSGKQVLEIGLGKLIRSLTFIASKISILRR